jgi:hypothetical protein
MAGAAVRESAGTSRGEAGKELVIIGLWAFDIIYEFVYQFQDTSQNLVRLPIGCAPPEWP